jgi:hypothetical protein
VVDDRKAFSPPRRLGLIFQLSASAILVITSLWSFWRAVNLIIGPLFLLYILLALLGIAFVPLLVYRSYALYRASYTLERDGILLRWGLRLEDIPMSSVLWVLHSSQLEVPLPRPWVRWPGSVLGVRRLPDGNRVEYLAARAKQLIFIATTERVFAISPEEPDAFLKAFQRFMELGSLTPLTARTIYPGFLLARVWRTNTARYLLLGGLLLNLLLLAWVSFVVPSRSQITLGFALDGGPVPAGRLLLLPLLSGFFFLLDVSLGLFLFRQGDNPSPAPSQGRGFMLVSGQLLAYMLWVSAVLTALLFLLALFFILQI